MSRLLFASALTIAAATATPGLAQTTPATPHDHTATAAPAAPAAPAAQATAAAPAAPAAPASTATTTVAQAVTTTPTLATLAKAAKAAGLEATLAGAGPITVFAPNDEAFGRLAPGTMDTLLKPENQASLKTVVGYHVVAGKLDAEALKAQVQAGGGKATLTTVAGQTLTAAVENGALTVTDVSGTKSYVTQYDLEQSNGVVHVLNGVLIPKLG